MSRRWLALTLTAVLGACGGGGSSPSAPGAPTPTPTPAAPSDGPTFTITASGVSPKQLEITAGSRVTFTNQDTAAHEVASDPHPTHTDCPPINEVSGLAPGQSRQTAVFSTPRSCGFHDHGQPTNTSLQGTIVIR